jgi:hypothetical protein
MDRSTGTDMIKSVPGCTTSGSERGMNMCYVAQEGELVFVWDNLDVPLGLRANYNLKLDECQGDCDSDWDCDVSDFCACL